MAVNASLITFDVLRSLGYASISDSAFTQVGTTVGVPIRMIVFSNTTDQDIIVSFDAVHNHTVVPAGSGVVFDYCSNKSDQAGMAEQGINTPIYVTAPNGAPSKGSFYVTVIWVNTRGQ